MKKKIWGTGILLAAATLTLILAALNPRSGKLTEALAKTRHDGARLAASSPAVLFHLTQSFHQ